MHGSNKGTLICTCWKDDTGVCVIGSLYRLENKSLGFTACWVREDKKKKAL